MASGEQELAPRGRRPPQAIDAVPAENQAPESTDAHKNRPIPPLKRLDGAMQAKVKAALAGLIILGFGAVLLAWLGARVTQRYRLGTSYFRPTQRPGEHDWARKRLLALDEKNNGGPASEKERG